MKRSLSWFKRPFAYLMNRMSIRFIVGGLILVILLMIAGGYWFYRFQKQSIYTEKYNELAHIGNFKVNQIVAWQNERLSDLRVFSSLPLYRKSIVELINDSSNSLQSDNLLASMQIIKKQYQYEAAMITTPDGKIVMSTNVDVYLLEPESIALVTQVVKEKKPVMGDFFRRTISEHVYLDFAAPIFDSENHVVGVFILRIDPDHFIYPLIQSWPTPSQSAETLLVRREGENVVFLNTLRHADAPPLTKRIPLSQTAIPAVQAVLGSTGRFEGLDYRNIEVVSHIEPVAGTSWFLISKIDTQEILTQIRTLGLIVFFLVLFSTFLTLALAAYFFIYRQRGLYQKLLQIEKAAQLEHNLLSETLNASMNEIYLFDSETLKFRAVNDGALNNLGYSHDQMQYMTPLDIKPMVNMDQFFEIISPLLEGKQDLVIFETMHERKNRSRYPVEIHLQLVKVGESRVFLAVIQDITERKQSEEKLRISFEKYRVLFQTFPLGVMVTDHKGQIIEVNAEAGRLLDMKEEDILKRPFTSKEWIAIHKDGSRMDPEEFPGSLALKNNEVVENVELGIIKTNRELVWVNSTAAPIPLKEYGVLIIMADISDRIRIENDLMNSEERYRKLVENSPDAIFINRENKIDYINTAGLELFGAKDSDQIVGKSPFEFIHPDYHEIVKQRNEHMITLDVPVPIIQEKIVRLDRSIRDVEAAATPFRDTTGQAIQVILRDITDRKQAEEKVYEQINELRRWHQVTLGREKRIMEMKTEINQLLRSLGQPERYEEIATLKNVDEE